MTWFDSHCHLTDARFGDDVDEVVARARVAGVSGFVVIASSADDAVAAGALARRFGVWSSAGIHPHEATDWEAEFGRVEALSAEPGVVALGETGLDYHYDHAPRPAQRASLERHLELARDVDLPVIVHARDADADMIALIGNAGQRVRGVLHSFAGGRELFEAGVDAGWYVSFSGLVTFKSYGTKDLVAATPPDRLLIETDSPYLAPVPHRGKRNEPAFVPAVGAAVAALLGESVDVVAERTTRNARTLFGLS